MNLKTNMLNSGRVASIDVFRALTMLCMIFVNDLWSLKNVPHWLGHADMGEDFLGLSDIVFPAFLFAVGLSIPFAIENRLKKGDNLLKTAIHIMLRTFALIVMGLFTVNYGAGISTAIAINRQAFSILMITGFFLVWNVYPRSSDWTKKLYIVLKYTGVALLVYLAFIYRDKGGGVMQIRWWGILGQIGWTYLPCALIYLIARKKLYLHLLALLVFILLNIAGCNHWLGFLHNYIHSNGAHQVLTMTGIIVSLLLSQYGGYAIRRISIVLISTGIALLLAGFASNYFWIINKISATPSWVFLCAGISVLLYVLLYWLVDVKGKEQWFAIIKPAGTATLTCYLVPYIVYCLLDILSVKFPDVIRLYPVGLLKSLALALVVIGITALLGKIHVKLKI